MPHCYPGRGRRELPARSHEKRVNGPVGHDVWESVREVKFSTDRIVAAIAFSTATIRLRALLAAAHSAAILGIDALDVIVEVHVANGLPRRPGWGLPRTSGSSSAVCPRDSPAAFRAGA